MSTLLGSQTRPGLKVQRVWLMSDLHQEFTRSGTYGSHPKTLFDPLKCAPADIDVVVLAGDIDVPLARSIQWAYDRFAGVPIIYVPGNHDYYVDPEEPPQTYIEIEADAQEAAAKTGVNLLIDDHLDLNGIRYIGSTLWTDFALGAGSISSHIAEASSLLYGMNDYRAIKRWSSKFPGKRKRLRPLDTIAAHHRSRAYLSRQLASNPINQKVVISHHAPLAESIANNMRLPWCYASRLDSVLSESSGLAAWMHGHVHTPVDYRFGRTRVVSNPRGYAFQDTENGFSPNLVVTISPDAV